MNVALVTLRHRLTPRPLLGRVNATARVAIMSSLPLGALSLGAVSDLVGVRGVFLIAAIGRAVVFVDSGGPLTVMFEPTGMTTNSRTPRRCQRISR